MKINQIITIILMIPVVLIGTGMILIDNNELFWGVIFILVGFFILYKILNKIKK